MARGLPREHLTGCQNPAHGAFPKTRLVLKKALEKAAKIPLFPPKSKVAFPKLKFWKSLHVPGISVICARAGIVSCCLVVKTAVFYDFFYDFCCTFCL
ncbi:MAG: hypothetical protein LBT33_05635, partial [Spirochaetia bacterium]|nr:hypothetical protein [Spirochaetia bacterium]